jgi:hypothetical protein
MDRLRLPPRALLLPALLAVAALFVLAAERSDRVLDAVEGDALGTLLSVTVGLVVAAVVLSRVSARRSS